MNERNNKIWFPAKTYGWGWGPPTCWQGWVVIAVFAVLVAAGGILLLPAQQPGYYILYVFALSMGLTWVCWLKGEKPRWRWGKEHEKGDDRR